MTTKTQQYAIQSLAACGFAVMRSTVAWQLRPDLWSSAQECGIDFSGKVTLEGVIRVNVTLDGVGVVPVLTRSMGHLAERIQWITGYMVLKIEEEKPAATVPDESRPMTAAQKKAAEHLQSLRKLAVQDLPVHDCALKRDILAARQELGRMTI